MNGNYRSRWKGVGPACSTYCKCQSSHFRHFFHVVCLFMRLVYPACVPVQQYYCRTVSYRASPVPSVHKLAQQYSDASLPVHHCLCIILVLK